MKYIKKNEIENPQQCLSCGMLIDSEEPRLCLKCEYKEELRIRMIAKKDK